MKILLDTNRYSDLIADDQSSALIIRQAESVFVPAIVLGELRFGFSHGNRVEKNEARLVQFLANPGVFILPVDEATSRFYATIAAQLRRQATPIPQNDMWIAALTVQHDLVLYARDKHFDRLPQVRRV